MNICTRIGRAIGMKIPVVNGIVSDCTFYGKNANGSEAFVLSPNGDLEFNMMGWRCFAPNIDLPPDFLHSLERAAGDENSSGLDTTLTNSKTSGGGG